MGFTSFLTNYAAKKALDLGITLAQQYLGRLHFTLLSSAATVEKAIERHLVSVEAWASEVAFADLKGAKVTQQIFVELDCFVMPQSQRMDEEAVERIQLESLFEEGHCHFLFLGTPGAGKTTSMKNICARVLLDESFATSRISFPLLVKLRDLNGARGKTPLVAELGAILGVNVDVPRADPTKSDLAQEIEARRVQAIALSEAVSTILDSTKALVVLEGFDEIVERETGENVFNEIRELALKLQQATLVVTSRTGTVKAVDNMRTFEICSLTDDQILEFAENWLGGPAKAQEFVSKIKASPFGDSTIKPLNLAHLCALYERTGVIPEKPKTVYKKILRLLLEDWDEQRSVRRRSRYASFEADRKYDFLSTLAYHLTAFHGKVEFETHTIVSIYRQVCHDFSLPENEAKEVAREVESHTGLLLKCGFDKYGFAHKSLHEFLAAEFLVRLPSIPSEPKDLVRLPNELAIAVAISSNASLYFRDLVLYSFQPFQKTLGYGFFATFMTRLLLERPDFGVTVPAVVGLITLYSIALNVFSDTDGHLSMHLVYPAVREFEQLLLGVMKGNKAHWTRSCYQFVSKSTSHTNDIVYRFKKIAELDGQVLPAVLFVRSALTEEFFYVEVDE